MCKTSAPDPAETQMATLLAGTASWSCGSGAGVVVHLRPRVLRRLVSKTYDQGNVPSERGNAGGFYIP
jgi:hypothetical protein